MQVGEPGALFANRVYQFILQRILRKKLAPLPPLSPALPALALSSARTSRAGSLSLASRPIALAAS